MLNFVFKMLLKNLDLHVLRTTLFKENIEYSNKHLFSLENCDTFELHVKFESLVDSKILC